MLLHLRAHPAAGVAHAQLHEAAGAGLAVGPRPGGVDLDQVDGQHDLSAVRHGIAGVDAEIEDDLVDHSRIGLDRGQVGGRPELDGHRFPEQSPDHRQESGDVRLQVHRVQIGHLPPAEGQQLPRNRCRPTGFLLQLEQIRLHLRREPGLLAQEAQMHHESRQHVVEIVGHAAGQSPHGLDLLELPHLQLESLVLRHVTQEAAQSASGDGQMVHADLDVDRPFVPAAEAAREALRPAVADRVEERLVLQRGVVRRQIVHGLLQ